MDMFFIIKTYKKALLLFVLALNFTLSCAFNDWHGRWIQATGVDNQPNTWQIFRKDFILESVPSSLIARIAVDSKYWLWINDSLVVFEGGLKRGPNPTSSYYDEIDISPYLQKGNNLIAILTWFFGKSGFSHNSSNCAALLFDAHNDKIDISSDETWLSMIHPCYKEMTIVPNVRFSESNLLYDSNLEIGKWYSIDYDKNLPKALVVSDNVEEIIGELHARPIPFFKFSELKAYESTDFDETTRILSCKLPYCAQITPYLKVSSIVNDTIDIYTDQDIVSGDQCVRAQYKTYRGTQEYESLGWMVGHNIYYHVPEGIEIEEVKYRESGYDCDIVGSFECSDDYINELWRRSTRTLYVNMRDTYMDCPDRERAQWWGDVVNEIQQSPYVMSNSVNDLTKKAINELLEWQRPSGVLFSPIPGNYKSELPVQMLMSVGQYGFYSHYWLDGDSTFIERIYDGVHNYLHNIWKLNDDGTLQTRSGDWNWGDWGDNKDITLLQNCWYYLALKAEAVFAQKINRDEDFNEINEMLQLMKSKFVKNFWSDFGFRSKNYIGETDDRANALAVLCDFVNEKTNDEILSVLKNNIFASPLMEFYVFRALCKLGHQEIAMDRLKKRYKKMMSYDKLTTLCEHYSIDNGSVNHAWGGWIPAAMAEEICGIKATSPAFKTFDICPNLGHLDYANISFNSYYGRIAVNVSKSEIDIYVPSGSFAHLLYNDINEYLSEGLWHFDVKATNIIDIKGHHIVMKEHLYNINGQQIDKPSKGIYIKNQKKYLNR